MGIDGHSRSLVHLWNRRVLVNSSPREEVLRIFDDLDCILPTNSCFRFSAHDSSQHNLQFQHMKYFAIAIFAESV